MAPADNCTCICKFFSGPFGTFYCFANAQNTLTSRWTSEHFSIVEIYFSPAPSPNPLKDKYGVSWQVTPVILAKMVADKNKKKVENMMAVMMNMKKLDIYKLESAFNEK